MMLDAPKDYFDVTNEYVHKFKKLDRQYTPEMVGGNGTGVGPFEAAQQQFLEGQVTPLCVGLLAKSTEISTR